MPRRTKPSTPRLSEIAQHVKVPSGITSTGWPAVEAKCAELGIRFRPWQPLVGRIILAKRATGKYAATIGGTGLSICRQTGKTYLVGAIVFALCLLFPNLTVVWTAHRLRTANETFAKLLAFSRRRKIAPHMLRPVLGSGEQEIRFRNGSRILFGARERGFGRGFDEVDVLIFDEAQILTDNALDDMIPATNQSRQPSGALLLFMGTPPKKKDPSEVWLGMRAGCLSGEDTDSGWIELGADPGYVPTPAPADLTAADWKQVAKANPSFPDDTPREAILRMRKKLGAESFLREGLGIYDDEEVEEEVPALLPSWGLRARPDLEPPEVLGAIGIGVSVDRAWSSIATAGQLDDGTVFVAPHDRRRGTAWVAAEAKRIQDDHSCAVVIDGRGPGRNLITALEDEGVNLTIAGTSDAMDAVSGFYDDVELEDRKGDDGQPVDVDDPPLVHSDEDELNEAFACAVPRDVGDRWLIARRKSEGDTSMAEGAVLARWGLLAIANGDIAINFAALDMCDRCGKKPHEDPTGKHDYLCTDCREEGDE